MQDLKQEVTDVEFTETTVDETDTIPVQQFDPVGFLTNLLKQNGLIAASAAWKQNIDSRAYSAEKEEERIFFTNRALRLFLAEQTDRENITPRMLLADGIDGVKWSALIEQGIIPWLMNQFDKKGKRVQPEAVSSEQTQSTPPWESLPEVPEKFQPGSHVKPDDDNRISARSDGDIDDYNAKVASGEIVAEDAYKEAAEALAAGVIVGTGRTSYIGEAGPIGEPGEPGEPGVGASVEGSGDQSTHMPVKWDVPVKSTVGDDLGQSVGEERSDSSEN